MRERIGLMGYVIAVAVAPLINFGKRIVIDVNSNRGLTAITYGDYQLDFMSYFKEIFLIIGALILLISMSNNIDLKKECRGIKLKYYLCCTLLLFFIIMSFLTSIDRNISLLGISGRFEGALAEISYMVIFLVGLSFFKKINSRETVLKIIMGFSGLIFLIGIFQFFGLNIFEIEFMSNIITSFDMEKFGGIEYSFGKYASYGTLSNPNYMGSYSVMLFFLGLGYCLRSEEKRTTILLMGYCGLSFSNLIGCHSRAGFLGFQVGIILFVVIQGKEIIKNWEKLTASILLCTLIWVGMDYFSQKAMGDKLGNISKGLKTEVYGIEADANSLVIEGLNNLRITGSSKGLEFYDSDGEMISIEEKEKLITLEKLRYEKYYVKKHNSIKDFYLLGYGDSFDYQIYFKDGIFYTVDHVNKITDIPKVKRVRFFDGYEKKGTSRIYIWSRSIPKIFEKPFFGHGQDTFPLVFPQYDFFGKKLAFETKGILVSKPHNYFIQVALNNGIPALLLVLFLFLAYFYESLKSFVVKKDVFNVCIFLSVFSYFVTCFFNDSVVSVAPLFWTLLAVGICLNSEGKEIL